jgi:hypothetical protein
MFMNFVGHGVRRGQKEVKAMLAKAGEIPVQDAQQGYVRVHEEKSRRVHGGCKTASVIPSIRHPEG